MTDTRKHTLERIVETLGKNFGEDRVHTAMLLAYAEAVYSIVRRDCVPSPLYRVAYDETNKRISMEETFGLSLPPEENALDISVVDEIFCCNIRDIPLLLEGETGVGKTFAAMKYLTAVFMKEHFFSYRLSASAFLNNLFSHFQEGKMVSGMPVITAKMDAIDACAAGLTDEINRGDSNETLQLFDNEMHLGGIIYKLGLHIPELDDKGKLNLRSGRKKNLLHVCAQNPAGTEDAKFTQTMQLDAAVDNRLLKTYVGNASPSAGATLWLGEGKIKPHEAFLENFSKKVAEYLGIDAAVLSDLSEDWLSTYAWITEAARTDKPILYSALELSDAMIAVFSGNLIKYYDYERKVLEDWNKQLGKGVEIADPLQETEHVKKLHEVIGSFKVPIIFRDIVQIKKIADVLATLKNIKDALKSNDHVQTYLDTKRYVTVREVAEATALLARNKQASNADSPIKSINDVLAKYVNLVEEYMQDSGYVSTSFDLFDPNIGIKKIAVYKALRDTVHGSNGVEYLSDRVAEQAKNLVGKITVSEDLKNILIARSAGDLMTLCGFLKQYKDELEPIFKGYGKDTKIPDVIEELGAFYYRKLKRTGMVMPDIYQHRIQRTLGS